VKNLTLKEGYQFLMEPYDIYLVVFKLEQDKFYLFYTTDYERAFVELKAGFGTCWTNQYRPVSVDFVIVDSNGVHEKSVLYKYFKTYGIDNVRGGPYSHIVLTALQRQTIQTLLLQEDDELVSALNNISISK